MSDKNSRWSPATSTSGSSELQIAYNVPSAELPGLEEPSGICSNCEARPATEIWVGEGGSLALSHGLYSHWCKRCCLVAQIEYANGIIERLPNAKRQLAEIDAEESSPPA